MLKNTSIIYFLSNPIKFLIIVIYLIPITIYAQSELDYKIVNKTQDTVISIVFIVTNVLLINGLSDKIYS